MVERSGKTWGRAGRKHCGNPIGCPPGALGANRRPISKALSASHAALPNVPQRMKASTPTQPRPAPDRLRHSHCAAHGMNKSGRGRLTRPTTQRKRLDPRSALENRHNFGCTRARRHELRQSCPLPGTAGGRPASDCRRAHAGIISDHFPVGTILVFGDSSLVSYFWVVTLDLLFDHQRCAC